MARTLSLWLPVALYMAAIFWFSSMTSPPGPEGISDKWQHGLAYAGLALVTLRATTGGRWWAPTARAAALAWAIAAGYGASDELHQAFTPGRTPDAADLVADAAGAAAGLGAAGACGIIGRFSARPRGPVTPS